MIAFSMSRSTPNRITPHFACQKKEAWQLACLLGSSSELSCRILSFKRETCHVRFTPTQNQVRLVAGLSPFRDIALSLHVPYIYGYGQHGISSSCRGLEIPSLNPVRVTCDDPKIFTSPLSANVC